MKNSIMKVIASFLVMILCQSCGSFSFTGTTLSQDLKTITIQNFVMATAGGPQNMSITLNEKLKEYYQRNTNLKLKQAEGDLRLEGAIVSYDLSPVSATSSDKAALNRLTITVEVRFENKLDENQGFERDFSFYQDFSAEKSLTEVEATLVPKILDQLVLDIFTNTAAQW